MRMMKLALLVAVLAASASVAHAGSFTFGLGGGVGSPSGTFSDVYKLGFGGNVYGDYWLAPNYSIGADIDGSFFNGKDDYITSLKTTSYPDPKATATLIGFGVHGMLAFPMEGSVHPFLTAGVGMYNGKFKVEDAGPTKNFDTSDTKFGFHGGGGVDFKAGETMMYGLDVKYHNVQTEGDATGYITAGLHLTFTTTGTTTTGSHQ
jgi:opacity protein-like surface antigen